MNTSLTTRVRQVHETQLQAFYRLFLSRLHHHTPKAIAPVISEKKNFSPWPLPEAPSAAHILEVVEWYRFITHHKNHYEEYFTDEAKECMAAYIAEAKEFLEMYPSDDPFTKHLYKSA